MFRRKNQVHPAKDSAKIPVDAYIGSIDRNTTKPVAAKVITTKDQFHRLVCVFGESRSKHDKHDPPLFILLSLIDFVCAR